MGKNILVAASLALVVLFLAASVTSDASAARFGGGKSFGGKTGYSRSAPAPQRTQQAPGNSAYSRQQNQVANPGVAPRSGLGGMFGGLLAGTLLGAMFFGGSHAGLGVIDIAMFALLGFLALKLFGFVAGRRTVAAGGDVSTPHKSVQTGDPWRRMRGEGQPLDGGGALGVPNVSLDGFDEEDFLRGAKMLFIRLQESWDKRDIEDIASFTTPSILREVEQQAEADPTPSVTEILLVNGNLISVERAGNDDVATVFFDVLVRENPEMDTACQVREIWHFIRPAGATLSWRLDGIQQVQ